MEHQSLVRTRFCESDALGHINNVSFFIYLEQARVDFFIDTQILEDIEDWSFVAASVHCDFKKQAFVNQSLVIKTWVSHIGRTSVKLKHQIFEQNNEELIAEGEDVLVSYNVMEQKADPLSEQIKEKLKLYTI
ncbi:thioesterase family protein [Neobacillus sp. PS3-12]|uniref:acyl-CoA thioesterase n=1 Tax=Neobacillus sp. PS3-12 TaxID=3070677 RepID=UPI0027E00BFD|nr:thioesterase family protein [Neobacillus sp. PS3-12]WML52544.1 thioesterase family protein [Neobacillus sp. PS3-12]